MVSFQRFGLMAVLLVLLTSCGKDESTGSTTSSATAEEAIKDFCDYVGGLHRFKVNVQISIRMTGAGLNQDITFDQTITVERPNRLAMIGKGAFLDSAVVSDGEHLYTYLGDMNQYTEEPAPTTLGELITNPAMGVSGGWGAMIAASLFSDDPYETTMAGVEKVEYVGTETLDGIECHRLKGYQPMMTWELWITTGDTPLPVQMVPDMSAMFENQGEDKDAAFMKDMKMDVMVRLSDWQTKDVTFAADTFKFTPPEGTEKVDSLFEGLGDEEEPAMDLVGRPAPMFKLPMLDGGEIDLAQHKGKDVVLLDFWAVRCSPCVRALPKLAELTKAYDDKPVAIYTVNLGDPKDAIRNLLKRLKCDVKVLLDEDGEIGNRYLVSFIPQTVLIGKDGTVQAVHTGSMPDFEKTLAEQLDALLEGKTLATTRPARDDEDEREKATVPSETTGAESAWIHPGSWTGVATDPGSKTILAVDAGGKCVELDSQGEPQRNFKLKEQAATLRTANLTQNDRLELITYRVWGSPIQVHDADGKVLWDYPQGSGVDDVWADDLTGDGIDEVIVGYNGGTGLHVLDSKGNAIWTYTNIGNVWHVCAGDVDGDGQRDVVTTSANGQVHVFDAKSGKKIKDIKAGSYTTMVRVCPKTSADKGQAIFTAGSGKAAVEVMVIRFDGKKDVSLTLPSRGHSMVHSAVIAPHRPWAAVGLIDSNVFVIDIEKGVILATITGQQGRPDVAWSPADKNTDPLLLIADGTKLQALRITGKGEMPATKDAP